MSTPRLLAVIMPLFFTGAVSSAQDLPIRGGLGGVPFRQQCDPGEYLVGFQARVGSWVDTIGILCGPPAAALNYQLGAPIPRGESAGGRGGSHFPDVRCTGNEAAVSALQFSVTDEMGGLDVDDPNLVTGLSFLCRSTVPPNADMPGRHVIVDSNQFYKSNGIMGRSALPVGSQSCPAGTLGVGIHGRAGQYLDALGLICGPAPAKITMGRATPVPTRRGQEVSTGDARVDVSGGTVSSTRPRPPSPGPVGDSPAPASRANLPLKLFWSDQRGDYFITPTAQGEKAALDAGYQFIRVEGYVLSMQQPGLVPLKLYWHPGRADNFSTATAQGEAAAKAAGYGFARIEGYVYDTQQPGTVPLKLFWNQERGDNFTLASPEAEQAALDAGYGFARVEGYVFPATTAVKEEPVSPDSVSSPEGESAATSVAGSYRSIVRVTTSTVFCGPAVPVGTTRTGVLSVIQPTPQSVMLGLTALPPLFESNPTLRLTGTQVSYSGPLHLSPLHSSNGTVTGTIDGRQLNMNFRATSYACTMAGTIIGTRDPATE